ncbi:MAG: hypothetical protein ABUK08_03700 [Candidatus Humimicrobiaceae bacterium]
MEIKIDLKSDIKFYDSNVWIGENNYSEKLTIPENSIKRLLSDKKKNFNITGNLITHHMSYFYYPRVGNDILASLISNEDLSEYELAGVMAMEQDYFSEHESFEKGLKTRYQQGFRALRLFPRTHKYPFEIIGFGKFYEVLDHYNFPVIISLDEIDITGNKNIEWERILEIASKFKDIPLIIDGGTSKELIFNSYLFSLLGSSENIYLNTHNLLAMDQLEDLVDAGGEKRLLFDSNFPYLETHLSVGRLINAGLSLENKNRIAGLNIKNIFEEIKF